MAEYQFILQAGSQSRVSYPIWKKDLSKEYAYEQNQMFMRAKLTGNLIFQRNDYDFIMAQSIETKIYLTIKVDYNHSGIFTDYWRGVFHLTDCTINVDDKMVTVKPDVLDKYYNVLAGLDKEFDIIKMKVATQNVEYYRRPLLQVYVLGEAKVSCYLGGMYWEEDVSDSNISEDDLREYYYFGIVSQMDELRFAPSTTGLTEPMVGFCDIGVGHTGDNELAVLGNSENVYYISYFAYQTLNYFTNGLRIRRVSDDALIWEWSQRVTDDFDPIPSELGFVAQLGGYSNITAYHTYHNVYARVLHGKNFGSDYALPSGDFVADNRNYRFCQPYPNGVEILSTTNHSATPTRWGKRPDGTYYLPPRITNDEIQSGLIDAYYPLAQNNWGSVSLWLLYTNSLDYEDENYKAPTTLKDAYTLEGVISALLKELDTNITFAATSDYSQFLYGTNPITNEWGRIAITPKSNIIVAQYSQPAQQAPIKLSEVLTMLKNVMGCYWFIDDTGKFRIEHISWFKNGGSYSATPTVGINITELYNSRNRQKWSLGTAQYQYDKVQMPERYEFAWSDNTTEEFKGQPIEVISTFVQEGNIEEVNIAKFNSDIDYCLLNPSDVSMDGFVLMCCAIQSGKWVLKTKQLELVGDEVLPYKFVTLQNYQLSMIFLQPNLLISDMPAWNIKVNGEYMRAKGIKRNKQQEVNIPMPDGDGDMQKLIGTTIGNGEIYRMTLNLDSRMAKIQLRYDTV